MRLIAVDDEQDTLEEIKLLVAYEPDLILEQTYTNPLKALAEIDIVKPDCVFLDIEMPVLNGLDLAERILSRRPETGIVFITAFNNYATEAFEANALDYVLKPIHQERFAKVIEKLRQYREPAAAGGSVVIQSLGPMAVLVDGQAIRWNRAKSRELFAFLLHHAGARQNKFIICEALWPETEPRKALVNLQTAMCSLRKTLMPVSENEIRIAYAEDCYTLYLKNAIWDAESFEMSYKQVQSGTDSGNIQAALGPYHGDYFSGEDWDWAMLTSQSLGAKYDYLLGMLADRYFVEARFHDAVQALLNLLHRRPLSSRQQINFLKPPRKKAVHVALINRQKY